MLASVHGFPKGSTLKATMVVFNNEVCSNFTALSSRTSIIVQKMYSYVINKRVLFGVI